MTSQFPRPTKLTILMLAALVVRLVFAASGLAFQIDMNTFKAWADLVFFGGMSNFYFHGAFTDYPPGYIYVLFVIGWLRALFQIDFSSTLYDIMIMTPAILADLATGWLIYRLALAKLPAYALIISAAYLFNPAIILNSSVWGQVDAVYLLPIILSLVMLAKRQNLPAYLLYTLSILIKPQAMILAPIYLHSFAIVFYEEQNITAALTKLLRWGACCVVLMFALTLPFARGFNILPILAQYIDTMTQYSFASLNAYNFHAFVGAMWLPQDTPFLGIPLNIIGHTSIIIITLLSLYLLRRDSSLSNMFFVAALLSAFVFVFSVRMHERYLYAAVPMLLLAYIHKPHRRLITLFGAFTLTFSVNVIDALRMLNNNVSLEFLINQRWVSALNLVLIFLMLYTAFKLFGSNAAPLTQAHQDAPLPPVKDIYAPYFEKYEWHLLSALVLVYALVAFTRLGDLEAPQSFWDARWHQEEAPGHPPADRATINLGAPTHIDKIQVYLGARHDQHFSIETSSDGQLWHHYRDFHLHSVFAWHDFHTDLYTQHLRITPLSSQLIIGELGLRNQGHLLTPPYHTSAQGLFDEQHTVPNYHHFMNSTYFDEIYHPRTAFEFIHGMHVYENTHPPLGKVIKSWGIRIFGMTPFGWRFAGTFVGVLMILPMYFLARELLDNNKPLAFVAAGLFTFDFMHFAQTRLATIDTYVTFFVILMYLFMYMYYKNAKETTFPKDMLWLLLSGLCMGLGIASKWQGLYAAAGLALLWLIAMIHRYRQHGHTRQALTTTGLSVIFFVIVPLAVYVLSYIPFLRTPDMGGLSGIIANQVHMFTYHAGIDQPHPFSARWWEWPLNLRPMFMYMRWLDPYVAEGISSFGNPVVWWGGLAGIIYAIYRLFDTSRPRQAATFLVIGFGAQFVPWMFVPRTTYIYHYFPSVPFITLALTYMLGQTTDHHRPWAKYAILATAVGLFIMFYPVLSGLAVSAWYVDTFLRWISTWRLI